MNRIRDIFDELKVVRRGDELLRSLGIDKMTVNSSSGGTAIRMWFREWTAETFLDTADLRTVDPTNLREHVASRLIALASEVRSMGLVFAPFKPSAPLLLESPTVMVKVPLEWRRKVISTPNGEVEVDPPRVVTLRSMVLDEIAKIVSNRYWFNTERQNTAFAEEPDDEYESRLRKMAGGEDLFQELWNEVADKVDPPKPFANRFEAIAAEMDPEKKT